MTIPKKKREKIRKHLKDRKTWEYIRNKEGVSNDAINKIRRESPSSTASTTPQADKTPRVIQDQTKQIIDKVSITDEDKKHPTKNNTPNPNYQRLEQIIKDSDHARQTQQQTTDLKIENVTKIVNQLAQSKQTQETKELLPEKPDNQPNLRELTHQETKSLPSTITQVQQPNKIQDQIDATAQRTKIDPPFSPDANVEQTSEVDSDQTDEFLQEGKREYFDPTISQLKIAKEIFHQTKRLYNAYNHYKKTGVYILPPEKENEKNKET